MRIEMIGVGIAVAQLRLLAPRRHEAVAARRMGGDMDVLPGGIGLAVPLRRDASGQPPVMQPQQRVDLRAGSTELVQIGIALAPPIAELDAQLERALRRAHELRFVHLQEAVELLDRRDRRFAHAHRADRLAFHQRYGDVPPQRRAQIGRRHPPARSAAHDQDLAHGHVLRVFGKGFVGGKLRHRHPLWRQLHACAMRRRCAIPPFMPRSLP